MNWTILGLILDAVGVVMVFYFTPERYPDPVPVEFRRDRPGGSRVGLL